ncbi:hypothetical protein L873DRAFT_1823689 [Choiromyces venosus 120613-1]|uniref:Uncharacterized protein n=1 Tax=Choiromyces venosus 120613-1 TaxID=1336337 RepID=A0A3N4ISS9_9PEZI|nr:hypothetical protein L873DRAFT_1823689 [Choiromyces venosus 120613-1]
MFPFFPGNANKAITNPTAPSYTFSHFPGHPTPSQTVFTIVQDPGRDLQEDCQEPRMRWDDTSQYALVCELAGWPSL